MLFYPAPNFTVKTGFFRKIFPALKGAETHESRLTLHVLPPPNPPPWRGQITHESRFHNSRLTNHTSRITPSQPSPLERANNSRITIHLFTPHDSRIYKIFIAMLGGKFAVVFASVIAAC